MRREPALPGPPGPLPGTRAYMDPMFLYGGRGRRMGVVNRNHHEHPPLAEEEEAERGGQAPRERERKRCGRSETRREDVGGRSTKRPIDARKRDSRVRKSEREDGGSELRTHLLEKGRDDERISLSQRNAKEERIKMGARNERRGRRGVKGTGEEEAAGAAAAALVVVRQPCPVRGSDDEPRKGAAASGRGEQSRAEERSGEVKAREGKGSRPKGRAGEGREGDTRGEATRAVGGTESVSGARGRKRWCLSCGRGGSRRFQCVDRPCGPRGLPSREVSACSG
ncbi:hypothetical protein AXG93_4343s1380 [Marchantia polymorpha subsp. ruderalis]|uniref:Uncharacterized protein n=1 Tax=Marchantia polymorpha subsp. ruderalis TaxID=1480154 RepID=A0A176VVH3_MARPO|nr:hypothetical protein AXG93_4343s1380 [Marchantia polymorpha subsp. ruderalis]